MTTCCNRRSSRLRGGARSMWKRYGMWLAIVVATWVAIVVVRGTTSLPRHRVVSITACYVALSDDLAPLLDRRVTDIAAASPECAPAGDARGNARDATGIRRISGTKRRRSQRREILPTGRPWNH